MVADSERLHTLRWSQERHAWRTGLYVEPALATYIGWYNARRRHRSLGR